MKRVTSLFTNRLYLSAVGVVLVFVFAVAYLYSGVLGEPLTHRPPKVTVMLTTTGGLYEGSSVTYRGVKVGKVDKIAITSKGIEATVVLTSSTKIPSRSEADVRSLSPVGEQYLDFKPLTDSGPYLHDGSVIQASATNVPLSLASTVIAVHKVLQQIDPDKLQSLLGDLAVGVNGTGADLGRITDQGQQLLTTLDDLYPVTTRLLHNGSTVLDIGNDNRAQLESLARNAKTLTAYLRHYNPLVSRTIHDAPAQIAKLQRLVDDAQRVLPGFLSVGVSLTDIVAAHDPELRALLQAYAGGLATLPKAVKNGQLQLNLILDSDPRCQYDVSHRSPRDTTRREMQPDGRCSASFAALQRGAAHAPGQG